MYLTRVFLDPTSRAVRQDEADAQSLHRTVMRLFPDDAGPEPRKKHGVLHRLDGTAERRLMLLIQSRTAPDTSRLPVGHLLRLAQDPDLVAAGIDDNPSLRDVSSERAAIKAGDQFVFRLKANTTRKIQTRSATDGRRSNGRRVPLRGDEARLDWLKRHAEPAGFEVKAVRVSEIGPRGRGVTFAGALFEGVLEVRDAGAFRSALETGIGPAKAFGFGLLSLSRSPK